MVLSSHFPYSYSSFIAMFCTFTLSLTGSLLATAELSRVAYSTKVACEGRYPGHLQGICLDADQNIYWSFTTWLVKTNDQGELIKKVPVANHHGDLCYVDGKVYVAVNLGKFNDPAGNADSWVYVYDADSLEEITRHEVQEVKHGAGGMAWHDGRFLVVGGLPNDVDENNLYEYDDRFHFVKRHTLASGHTHLGLQAATFAEDRWWFACYGSQLLTAAKDFQMKGRYTFECGYGIIGLGNGQFYIARGECETEDGCNGYLLLAKPNANTGLKVIQQ